MRALGVVRHPPFFDHDLCLLQGVENLSVRTLVPIEEAENLFSDERIAQAVSKIERANLRELFADEPDPTPDFDKVVRGETQTRRACERSRLKTLWKRADQTGDGNNRAMRAVFLELVKMLCEKVSAHDPRKAQVIASVAQQMARAETEERGERFTQEEANYVTASPDPARACERCRHFLRNGACDQVTGQFTDSGTPAFDVRIGNQPVKQVKQTHPGCFRTVVVDLPSCPTIACREWRNHFLSQQSPWCYCGAIRYAESCAWVRGKASVRNG